MALKFVKGEIVSTPPAGEVWLKVNDDGSISVVESDGTETTVGDNAATADAPSNAATFTAALNAATTSLQGMMSAADKIKANKTFPPETGTALTDTDQTITPGSDACSQYEMPAGVQSANRAVTLSNAGSLAGQICDICKPVGDAHTLAIKNAAGTTIHTIAAGVAAKVECYYTGAAWTLSVWFFL